MNELIIDSFAGGGGASLGIEWALGRSPDIAVNHNPAAIEMHSANHPNTHHLTEDVFRINPRKATRAKPVGLLWSSPDCRHFSRAKGGKPVDKSVRGLAWVVIKWAQEIRPRVIVLENVREFQDWGPLCPRWDCTACEWRGTGGQAKLGRRNKLACPRCESPVRETANKVPDPNRKGVTFWQFCGRLRALGYAIQSRVLNAADYGAPTHRRRLFLIARCDESPIVWPEETHGDPDQIGKDLFSGEMKPWRTAAECIDWTVPCSSIFSRQKPLAPKTLKRIAEGMKRYVIDNPTPFLVPLTHNGNRRNHLLSEPLPTVTAAHGGELAFVAPIIANLAYGDTPGKSCSSRTTTPMAPVGTVHAGGGSFALVSAFIAKYFTGVIGAPVDTPLPTTTTRGTQNQIVAANLIHMNHGQKQWSSVDEPTRTVTTAPHAALVYSFLTKFFGNDVGARLDSPSPTALANNHLGIVTVRVAGEIYAIADIGMRMLSPRELARAQGFPDSYVLTGTKTNQIERIGNSVVPQVAAAIVRANYREERGL